MVKVEEARMGSAICTSTKAAIWIGVMVGVVMGHTMRLRAEERENKFLYFGVEFFKADISKTESQVGVSNVPLEIRTVPSHPDDPYTPIAPLPDGTFEISPSFRILDYLRAKCMLWDIVGGGIRIAGSWADEEDHTGPVRLFDTEHFQGEYYNYAPHYSASWGAAYVLYQTYYDVEVPVVGFFVEAKTPATKIVEGFAASLFGGYEPDVAKIHIRAMNGWDRWDSMQVRQEFDLGKVSVDRAYTGLEFSFPHEDGDALELGFRLYYDWNLFRVDGPIHLSRQTSGIWGASVMLKF
jgi:hypothetical protein